MASLISIFGTLSAALGATVGGGFVVSNFIDLFGTGYSSAERDKRHEIAARDVQTKKEFRVKLPAWWKGKRLSELSAVNPTLTKKASGDVVHVHPYMNNLEGANPWNEAMDNLLASPLKDSDVVAIHERRECINVQYKAKTTEKPMIFLDGVTQQDLDALPVCGPEWYTAWDASYLQEDTPKWNQMNIGAHPEVNPLDLRVYDRKWYWDQEESRHTCPNNQLCAYTLKDAKTLAPQPAEHKPRYQPVPVQNWQVEAQRKAVKEWKELLSSLKSKDPKIEVPSNLDWIQPFEAREELQFTIERPDIGISLTDAPFKGWSFIEILKKNP
ncbi:hypothetical protein MHLP_00755 [Candidatus Mycoplasma haematolamae str. Purdue]|uniref:Uncharacterized protein n=1 Tax=Mycoplasma haematolamae (strain Purdue) TaxID=1212765 RepID=I7CEQ7_MYCHA|nr:hypothetical protein [Candidatus Mycoplasma haematolamae]AFO51731.1 hypothetical protein MHLP_00755 [Candidatus Mycoplasma haematolamae str. Purdue]